MRLLPSRQLEAPKFYREVFFLAVFSGMGGHGGLEGIASCLPRPEKKHVFSPVMLALLNSVCDKCQ